MLAGKLYQYELEKKQAEADNLQAEKKKKLNGALKYDPMFYIPTN